MYPANNPLYRSVTARPSSTSHRLPNKSIDFTEYWAGGYDGTGSVFGDTGTLLETGTEKNEFAVFRLEDSPQNFNSHSYIKFDSDAGNIPDVFTEQFDAVISLCAFEHIQKLEPAREMRSQRQILFSKAIRRS